MRANKVLATNQTRTMREVTRKFLLSTFKATDDKYDSSWNDYHASVFDYKFTGCAAVKTLYSYVHKSCAKELPKQACIVELLNMVEGVY